MNLGFDPFIEFADRSSDGHGRKLKRDLAALHSLGEWTWGLSSWKDLESFDLCLEIKNEFIDYCVQHQSSAWFASGAETQIKRNAVEGILWLEDGFRRNLYDQYWEVEFFSKFVEAEKSDPEFGDKIALAKLKTLHPSRLYWAHSIELIDSAYQAWISKDIPNVVRHSIEASAALRNGIFMAVSSVEQLSGYLSIVENARRAADARHSQPGGAREKQKHIQEIWASGKYSNRDLCAEEEYAAIGMSFSAARKALRNTPDPHR